MEFSFSFDQLGKVVRSSRKEVGLSQAKLAEKLNIDSRTILKIENVQENPSFDTVCRIMDYLNAPYGEIFGTDTSALSPSVQKLIALLSNCTDEEAENLLPMIRYMLDLMRKQ